MEAEIFKVHDGVVECGCCLEDIKKGERYIRVERTNSRYCRDCIGSFYISLLMNVDVRDVGEIVDTFEKDMSNENHSG